MEKSILIAAIIFLLGYAYLNINGTYWLDKKAEMSKFTNLYYINNTIFVENNEGKTTNYQLKAIKNNKTLLSELFVLSEKETKEINFTVEKGVNIYLTYENKSLEINPLG